MPNTYYFLHIPKTAGTSIAHWLTLSGRFKICPDGLWSQLLARPKAELTNYSLFCGHFYRYLPKYVGHSLQTFTFLRNPFSRALSHYAHIKRDTNHYFHTRVADQGSLFAFLSDPRTQPLVRNFQVRSLSAMFEPEHLAATIGQASGQRYPLEEYIETADPQMDDNTALLLAKEQLSRCIFVGITERAQESLGALGRMLGISDIHRVPRLNSDPLATAVDTLDRSEWKTLARLLEADWEIYDYACRLHQEYLSIARENVTDA